MDVAKSETKYERLRRIGIGSYGVVFKCVNRQTGQIVAIKRYSENDTDPIIRKIAMREVRMLRQLKHPNLIHLIEVFRRKRILHLVFDYCELTVLDVIEKYANNCPLNLIRKIIWQLVNGVNHCHTHNCIHRDIKPENILINQLGVVKLCDFGFARNLNASSSRTLAAGSISAKQVKYEREAQLLGVSTNQMSQFMVTTSNNSSINNNTVNNKADQLLEDNKENQQSERLALTEYVATRWYRAPELLVGDVYYDKKIDIWAIGCVTAELMRGEPIWPGKTDLDQLFMIKSSLGPLTADQTHTLLSQSLYDQTNIDRLLNQVALSDPLERKLPQRVGPAGLEFVLDCLQMDPARRPACDQLLQHHYIQSAQMSQFVRGASHTLQQSATDSASSALPSRDSASQLSRSRPNGSSPDARLTAGSQQVASRSNSQAILMMANNQQQPASKRLLMASEVASTASYSNQKHGGGGSLVPVPLRSRQAAATPTTVNVNQKGASWTPSETTQTLQKQPYKRKAPLETSGSSRPGQQKPGGERRRSSKPPTRDSSTRFSSQARPVQISDNQQQSGAGGSSWTASRRDSLSSLTSGQQLSSRKGFGGQHVESVTTTRRDRQQTNLGQHSHQGATTRRSGQTANLAGTRPFPANSLASSGSLVATKPAFLPQVQR